MLLKVAWSCFGVQTQEFVQDSIDLKALTVPSAVSDQTEILELWTNS